MSTETSTETKRTYRKRRRAELEDETRRRITEATMALHEEVGPAQTTVSAIAERAGVQRATVYRHFPDEGALVGACSALWMSLNAPPNPAAWAGIDDPDERLRTALTELYAWYERTEPMIERLLRDRAAVAPLDERMRDLDAYFGLARKTLKRGRGRGRVVEAAIAHALEFETWRSLVRRQGLGADEAVGLALRLLGDRTATDRAAA